MNRHKILFIVLTMTLLPRLSLAQQSANYVTWNPEDVSRIILENSIDKRELDLKLSQSQQNHLKSLSVLDWHASAEAGEELDSLKSLNTFIDFRYRRDRLNLGLSKLFSTGLNASLSVSSITQSVELLPSAALVLPPRRMFSENLSLVLEQSLWQNFLGEADQAQIKAAELSLKAQLNSNNIELKLLQNKALQSFWKAFITCENFQELESAKNRYIKIVESVKKRTQFSYNSPGELALAQAELENKIQGTRTMAQECWNSKADLLKMLGQDPNTDIRFNINKVPSPPQLQKDIRIENLTDYISQELRTKSAVEMANVAHSKNHPNLTFMAKASSSGVDSRQSNALSDMTDWDSPYYYIGVKLDYYFGSDILDKNSQIANATKMIEQEKMFRKKQEIIQQLSRTQLKYTSSYEQLQSILAQRKFREQAVKELNKTYNQGRTDISILIDSINKLYETNVRIAQGLSDYYLAAEEYKLARMSESSN